MDLDEFKRWAQLKMQANQEQPDLTHGQDLINAGISIPGGDPRLQKPLTYEALNPSQQRLWNAYLSKFKGNQ